MILSHLFFVLLLKAFESGHRVYNIHFEKPEFYFLCAERLGNSVGSQSLFPCHYRFTLRCAITTQYIVTINALKTCFKRLPLVCWKMLRWCEMTKKSRKEIQWRNPGNWRIIRKFGKMFVIEYPYWWPRRYQHSGSQ